MTTIKNINQGKRQLLQHSLILATFGTLRTIIATENNTTLYPFNLRLPENIRDKVFDLYQTDNVIASNAIKLVVPDIVENNQVVSTRVSALFDSIDEIALFIEHVDDPLVALIQPAINNNGPYILRIRIPDSTRVYAIVKSQGNLYVSYKETKYARGCGGGF